MIKSLWSEKNISVSLKLSGYLCSRPRQGSASGATVCRLWSYILPVLWHFLKADKHLYHMHSLAGVKHNSWKKSLFTVNFTCRSFSKLIKIKVSVQVGCTQSPFWLILPELSQLYREDSRIQLSAPLDREILLSKDLWIPLSQKKCRLDPHCNSLCTTSASSQRLWMPANIFL